MTRTESPRLKSIPAPDRPPGAEPAPLLIAVGVRKVVGRRPSPFSPDPHRRDNASHTRLLGSIEEGRGAA